MSGEEYSERAVDAAFSALEEISLFARQRGVEVLLENTPNALSSAERLMLFPGADAPGSELCLRRGARQHGRRRRGGVRGDGDRIRSTHIHDNDGKADKHLFPLLAEGGTIDWKKTMGLLRSRADQYPLLLELKEVPEWPLTTAAELFDRLENL